MNSTSLILSENFFSYEDYIREVDAMVKNKSTSGPDQSEVMINYTYLNYKRMSRLNKTVTLDDEITESLERVGMQMIWIAITEAWCGDAAQVLPVMNKFAAANTNIDLKLIMRDEHLDIMAR